MKWINNALLCCVQRGGLDYELSARTRGITMGGVDGVSPHATTAVLQHQAERTEALK